MSGFVLAAARSGSGKTVVSCALLGALKKRGLQPCSFKCGPDYIDPMYHRAALGVDAHNLDVYLAGADTVRDIYRRYGSGGINVVEGSMGVFDGVGGATDEASAWHVAQLLDLSIVLVVRPGGSSLTLAAEIRGLMAFREPCRIAAVILSDCTVVRAAAVAEIIERECGIPVLGVLPRCDEAAVASRHLGLVRASELEDLSERLDALAALAEEHIDVSALVALARGRGEVPMGALSRLETSPCADVRLGVASDEAFCFTYAESIDALASRGVEVVPFSPLHDTRLPDDLDGLYLPGGYPELHARALSEQMAMRVDILQAIRRGMPTVAECGGYLYLAEQLADADGEWWPMVGAIEGAASDTGHLVRFGYAELTAQDDSLLFERGDTFRIHEFHRWDYDYDGSAFQARKAQGATWVEGHATSRLYAGFPHLYLAAMPCACDRFVCAMRAFQVEKRV